MSSNCGLSCFECPALNLINHQLDNAQAVREAALAESLHAMDQLSEVDETAQDPVSEQYTALMRSWREKSETIFTPLDSAEATLKKVRVQIAEACTDGRPKEIRQYWLFGKTLLQCASPKAIPLLGRDLSVGPFKDK